MNDFLKRTWAEINLDNLHYNINQIKNKLNQNTKIMAVVKADGYGHGDKLIAKELSLMGIDFFAVSNLDEALSLRNEGLNENILILGFTPIEKANTLSELNITQAVFSVEYADKLNAFCKNHNIKINVHIKVDTGMGRLGIISHDFDKAINEINYICNLESLNVEGIFSHFSSSDNLDIDSIKYTKMQINQFDSIISALNDMGINFKYKHLQNSAGIGYLNNLQNSYDYARAGIVIYGLTPSNEEYPLDLKPVMELKTVVSLVKDVEPNMAISYSRKFVSDKKMKIATLPIGYADGYPRLLSNKASILIKGKRCKILGNICMDQLIIDVTDVDDVKMGDIATVVGHDGNEVISFSELANMIGTINYELVCLIGKRVPRVYKKDNKIIEVADYYLNN